MGTKLLLRKPLTWQQQLLSQFPAGDDVGIFSTARYGYIDEYFIYKHLYNNRYWRFYFSKWSGYTAIGGYPPLIQMESVADLYKCYNTLTTPAITTSGSWDRTAISSYYGGEINWATQAGAYIEVTSGNATKVGCLTVVNATTNGILLVTIDGDNTLANLLPTAQELVTAGTLPDTVLVANGGSLNPTDRVWNAYNNTANYNTDENAVDGSEGYNQIKWFADNLANAAHTIRITVTAYKVTGSSAIGFKLGGIIAGGTSTRASQGGNDLLVVVQNHLDSKTDHISYNFIPTGATAAAWLGHQGQELVKVMPVFTLDGTVITPGTLSVSGSELKISLVNDVRHPETGTDNVGLFELDYIFSKSTGKTIKHTLTWLTDGTAVGYPCMLSTNHAVMDRFKTYGNAEIDLTDGDWSENLNTNTNMIWAWDYNGNMATLMYIPDLATTCDNWVNSVTNQLYWADITTEGGWKKAYASRYSPAKAYLTNDVITSEANYRTMWFADGANAALAGKY